MLDGGCLSGKMKFISYDSISNSHCINDIGAHVCTPAGTDVSSCVNC